jgi:hypothetical protein
MINQQIRFYKYAQSHDTCIITRQRVSVTRVNIIMASYEKNNNMWIYLYMCICWFIKYNVFFSRLKPTGYVMHQEV